MYPEHRRGGRYRAGFTQDVLQSKLTQNLLTSSADKFTTHAVTRVMGGFIHRYGNAAKPQSDPQGQTS